MPGLAGFLVPVGQHVARRVCSEVYFCDAFWPAFRKVDSRRRFGT